MMSRLLSRREGDGLPGLIFSPAASYTGRAAFPNDPMLAIAMEMFAGHCRGRPRASCGNASSCLANADVFFP